jgi:mRNA interferase RelE/StbE
VAFSVYLGNRAEKRLSRLPRHDAARFLAALEGMRLDPFSGDTLKLQRTHSYRRRVGEYRILFGVDIEQRAVAVLDIARRTGTTDR